MEEKLLKVLRQAEGYVSGNEIAHLLGVSRTAVWKKMDKLRAEGYRIEAVTNKGYRLMAAEDSLLPENIKRGLVTRYLGQEILYFKEVDSTNQEIKRQAEQGAKEGLLVVAETQTAGKGRRGHTWQSRAGDGIYMSVLLRPALSPREIPRLTLIAGLAVCRAVAACTGLSLAIKWPNDILLDGKKLCGILSEMHAEMDKVYYAVVGIGINVNQEQFPDGLAEVAASCFFAGKRKYDRVQILRAVLEEMEKLYEAYILQENFAEFLQEYVPYCQTLKKEVIVYGSVPFTGMAVGLNQEGELLVQKDTGEIVTVFAGEVSIRNKEKSI